MSGERNVEALVGLMAEEMWGEDWPETGATPPMWLRERAEYLAARGVLVIDSLTDAECEQVAFAPGSYQVTPADPVRLIHAGNVRAALRRCATGEPQS